MATFYIPFSGGLVTSRPPTTLDIGEMAQTDDLYYPHDSGGLLRVPGPAQFSAATIGNVTGMKPLYFNSGAKYLLLRAGTTLWYSSALDDGAGGGSYTAGSYTAIPKLEGGTENALTADFPFDLIPLRVDKHAVLLESSGSRVVELASPLRTRPLGMQPVTATVGLSVVTGSWEGETPPGWWAYWATEYDSTRDLESSYKALGADGKTILVAVANVTTTAQSVLITLPSVTAVNPTTTHWRIYRSLLQLDQRSALNCFPTGRRIAQVAITETNYTDGATVATSALTPGAFGGTNEWAGAIADVQSSNNVRISAAGSGGFATKTTQLTTWTFPTINGSITGLEVVVEGQHVITAGSLIDQAPTLTVQLKSSTGKTTAKRTVSIPFLAAVGADGTITIGSKTDKWGSDWAPADFTGSFIVELVATVKANQTTYADLVTLKVWTGTSPDVSGLPYYSAVFPLVNGIIGGGVSRDGPPPAKSSTGVVFQDSLVLNDPDNPRDIVWSYPGLHESYPSLYRMTLDLPEGDKVVNIKRLGSLMVVCGHTRKLRINFLPREDAPSFETADVAGVISAETGCSGSQAATIFTAADGTLKLATISGRRVEMTDGYRADSISEDISDAFFTNTPSVTQVPILLDNSENFELLVYLSSTSNSKYATRRYHINYVPKHVKANGQPKWSGPGKLQRHYDSGTSAGRVGAACVVRTAAGRSKIYEGTAGGSEAQKVFLLVPSGAVPGGGLTLTMYTGRFSLFGEGKEGILTRAYALQWPTLGGDATLILVTSKSNADTVLTQIPNFVGGKDITRVVLGGSTGYRAELVGFAATGSGTAFDTTDPMLGIFYVGSDYGIEASQK